MPKGTLHLHQSFHSCSWTFKEHPVRSNSHPRHESRQRKKFVFCIFVIFATDILCQNSKPASKSAAKPASKPAVKAAAKPAAKAAAPKTATKTATKSKATTAKAAAPKKVLAGKTKAKATKAPAKKTTTASKAKKVCRIYYFVAFVPHLKYLSLPGRDRHICQIISKGCDKESHHCEEGLSFAYSPRPLFETPSILLSPQLPKHQRRQPSPEQGRFVNSDRSCSSGADDASSGRLIRLDVCFLGPFIFIIIHLLCLYSYFSLFHRRPVSCAHLHTLIVLSAM